MYVSDPVVCSRIRETDSLSSSLFVVIMASWTQKQSCVCAQGCHDFTGYTSSMSFPSSFLHWGKAALKLGHFGGRAMPQFSSLLSFSAQPHKHTSKKLASTLIPRKANPHAYQGITNEDACHKNLSTLSPLVWFHK